MQLVPAFVGGVEESLLEEADAERDDVLFDDTVSPAILGAAGGFGNVEDEEAGGVVVTGSQFTQAATGLWVKSGAIGDGEAVVEHTLVDNVMEEVKGVAVDALVGDVIADERTAIVG
jgi:hypothetical protein